jgi:hypothetical protein
MAVLPSAVAGTFEREPRKLPIGVRFAEMINTGFAMRERF